VLDVRKVLESARESNAGDLVVLEALEQVEPDGGSNTQKVVKFTRRLESSTSLEEGESSRA